MQPICCIYKLRNIKNDKFYLGSCKDASVRKKRHFTDLRKQRHHCIHLQRAYNKHGESAFVFEVVEPCSLKRRFKIEQKYLDNLDFSKAYNVSKSASGGNLIHNHPDKELIIKKKTQILLDYIKTDAHRARLRSIVGENNPNFGNKWSKALKKKISRIVKARWLNESSAAKLKYSKSMKESLKKFWSSPEGIQRKKELSKLRKGENNSFYGKKHSKQTKKILSKIHKGKRNPSCHKAVIVEGIKYESISLASKELNMPSPTVHYRCNSTNILFKEWNYEGKVKNVKRRTSYNAKKYIYKEQFFNSISEACKSLHITETQAVFRARSPKLKWADYEILS